MMLSYFFTFASTRFHAHAFGLVGVPLDFSDDIDGGFSSSGSFTILSYCLSMDDIVGSRDGGSCPSRLIELMDIDFFIIGISLLIVDFATSRSMSEFPSFQDELEDFEVGGGGGIDV
mmetsp:Transcript_46577/g.74884  ORF Transcript_46577/g.74884 Transcript_46577/m.74884 type:complete len:117 (+) Transcript_46577:52-402(+)